MKETSLIQKLELRKILNNYLIVIGIIILTVYTCIAEPAFFGKSNLLALLSQFVPASLIALGMTAVIVGGYIDLSCAGIFSLMGIVSGLLLNQLGAGAIVLILILGGLCGLADVLILNWCGAKDDSDALFITFGMQSIFGAMALLINNGNLVSIKQTSFTKFIGSGTFANIPVSFYIFLIAIIGLQFFMKKTKLGREIYLAGGNAVAARLSGVNITRVKIVIYVIIGVLASVAAFVQACRVGSAIPLAGKNYDTNAILAVAIGGTSLAGGKGGMLNTLLGVALVTIMLNALNILGIDTNLQSVWKGLILVAAIWIDSRRNK